MKKFMAILLAMILSLGAIASVGAEKATDIPREETLTYNGEQWGRATSFNPLEVSGNAAFGIQNEHNAIYERLYMYNVLLNVNEPYLAEKEIEWSNDEKTAFKVKLKENVHFNDGEPMDADDVVWSFNISNNDSETGLYTRYSETWQYLKEVNKVDQYVVEFVLDEENYNPLLVQHGLAVTPIMPEHIWAPRYEELGEDMQTYFNKETIGTGPYKLYFEDDTKTVLIRVEDYWGQAENMFGKLPAPKYLRHDLYQDNAAGNLAFGRGEVDVSQQFLPSVWELEKDMKAPVSTYFDGKPYHLGYGMPSLIFNISQDGTGDYAVRKAIALSLDYETIGENAMSGYTEDMIPSLYNMYVFGDYIDKDDEELQELMWDTTDIDGNLAEANRLLDEAGYKDVDGDGMREMPDGSKIEWKAMAPYGWSDWNATIEVLSESAKKVGLNVVTYFPEFGPFQQDYYAGKYDIAMWGITPTPSVAMPWSMAHQALYSVGVPPLGEHANRNTNRYKNERVDELVELSAVEEDPELLKEYYTEINKIWLQELPTVPLMYRPQHFHTIYEGYWTGFAKANDGQNIPPWICLIGAGIKDLFNITKVEK